MARVRLMPNPPPPGAPIPMELIQDDVDAKDFGVVVSMENGVYKDVVLVIVHCKGCNTVTFSAMTIDAITYLLAEAYTKHTTRRAIIAAATGENEPDAGGFMDGEFSMTDLDTGETTECNDLGEALFGKKDDSVSLEDAPTNNVTQFPGMNAKE